jgi:hypothetical protein
MMDVIDAVLDSFSKLFRSYRYYPSREARFSETASKIESSRLCGKRVSSG